MSVFISVVSHAHSNLINDLSCIDKLSECFTVVVKSNKEGDCFESFVREKGIYWINKDYGLGFGRNNNVVFNYCRSELGLGNDDYFIILNPDVVIGKEEIIRAIKYMSEDKSKLATINLFKDEKKTVHDNSIRRFPKFSDFLFSFLGFRNDSVIDKAAIEGKTHVDWAAGSFLIFKADLYSSINGFDERYFMYCEDIDICFRSNKLGEKLIYYPDVQALHLAKHANRSVVSKHFYWHLRSVFRFLLSKNRNKKVKSSLDTTPLN